MNVTKVEKIERMIYAVKLNIIAMNNQQLSPRGKAQRPSFLGVGENPKW